MEGPVPETRSPEPEFETLRELLDALGYDAESDAQVEGLIAEYADTYMVEDLGMNLFVNLGEGDDGEGMFLFAKMSFYTDDAVQMWVLDAPFTVSGINRHLDELDIRVRRLRAIVELPDAGEGDADDEGTVSIAGALGALFECDETAVISQLGDTWVAIDSDVVGTHSAPVRYLLWNECLVVGLDDEYVHLFAATFEDGGVEVGEVVSSLDLGDGATIELEEFARAVHDARALL
jgi:hypothetical protein